MNNTTITIDANQYQDEVMKLEKWITILDSLAYGFVILWCWPSSWR